MELCWDGKGGEELCGLEYESKKHKTGRERFLERMEELVRWERLLEEIRPYDPKAGRGRAPYELESMLRVHCVQVFYNLSDPAMEDMLYEIERVRRFTGISLSKEVRVWGDVGYRGMGKREAHKDRQVAWHIAMGPSQRRRLARDELERLMEECKSSVRAKVEHVFFHVKQMFGYGKVH